MTNYSILALAFHCHEMKKLDLSRALMKNDILEKNELIYIPLCLNGRDYLIAARKKEVTKKEGIVSFPAQRKCSSAWWDDSRECH